MSGGNLPQKANFQGLSGLAAKTGKANFDISEWMLLRLIDALDQRPACLAMLCKTSTARKVLRHAWAKHLSVGKCSIHLIDAKKHFGVSVDACLFIVHTAVAESVPSACVFSDLSFANKTATLGFEGKELVADIDEYSCLKDIDGVSFYSWRSGVKHDAAAVMEFTLRGQQYTNRNRESLHLESDFLFPLLKSSDIANGKTSPTRYVLVTQRRPSDVTSIIETLAPKTWAYLERHSTVLDNRKSIIYKKRPRFSIFGVGDYTFSPWKVAVSGLYKNCSFQVVGRYRGKPIVLDDTCCFIPCASESEATFVCELLNSDICQRFLRALVFFDAKRPITIDILNRVNLLQIACRLGRQREAMDYLNEKTTPEDRQLSLVF